MSDAAPASAAVPMYLVGIIVLAALACYLVFTAVDRAGIGSMVAPARVVRISYRAAGKTYVTEIVNNRPLVVPQTVPEAYLVDLDIEGVIATAAVDKAVHDGLRPGEEGAGDLLAHAADGPHGGERRQGSQSAPGSSARDRRPETVTMPLWPAVKLMDSVVGVDVHAVAPLPGIPVHPYFGMIFLWHAPNFPMANVFINGMPACTVGAMGYSVHVPQGIPANPPNCPYWKRYLTNVAMGLVLMGLTTMANIAIAAIASLIPKPPEAEGFLKDVTGIDTSSKAAAWESVKGAFSSFTKWPTWVKLLMPPIPYPGSQGSTAVGSPNVTVNGGPLAFVAPLVATSCSDIPVVPNAMTLGFSNVLVGVSLADMARSIAVNMAQGAVGVGVGKVAAKLPGMRGVG